MTPCVLVVEDESVTRTLVVDALVDQGITAVGAGDATAARASVAADRPALVVVDVGLPDGNGLDLLRELSTQGVPVIVLSGRAGEVDRVLGLELGAEDYVVKPFSMRELVARVRRVLRQPHRSPPSINVGDVQIDLASREILVQGTKVELTAREFDLLARLASAPRQVFSRAQLLREVWNSSPEWQSPRTVNEHIRRVRHKIEDDPARPRRIVTVPGVGYRFEP